MPLACALGEAVRLLPDPQEALEHVGALNRLLRERLSRLPGVAFHSPEDALPYVLNFSAGTVRGETMLHFLAQRGVYVSSGSACGRAKPSHVLEAMGLPGAQVQSALRASFSRFSTEEDVEAWQRGSSRGWRPWPGARNAPWKALSLRARPGLCSRSALRLIFFVFGVCYATRSHFIEIG